MSNLFDRIATLSNGGVYPFSEFDGRVTWEGHGVTFEGKDRIKIINKALENISLEERLTLFKDLIDLWRDRTRREEALKLFGEVRKYEISIGTLTGDLKQFRLWYGTPGTLQYNHVDSCGRGLLLTVYGHPEVVDQFIDVVFPDRMGLQGEYGYEIEVPNGTKVYMPWRNQDVFQWNT